MWWVGRAGKTGRARSWLVIVRAFAREQAVDGRNSGESSGRCNEGGSKGGHGNVEGRGQALSGAMLL